MSQNARKVAPTAGLFRGRSPASGAASVTPPSCAARFSRPGADGRCGLPGSAASIAVSNGRHVSNAFSHFDNAHRENFCAAVLLLVMELEPDARALVARLVRTQLGIDGQAQLMSFGREARLAKGDDNGYARVDIWLLFEGQPEPFFAFVEVKTHAHWETDHVGNQVLDQARRRVAASARQVRGSVLLAPKRLCESVRNSQPEVRAVSWQSLLREMETLKPASELLTHAIHHIEEQMEHPPGLPRALTLSDFEQAATTVACLRQFLVDCVADLGGRMHGSPLYLTPGDGRPRRAGGWAWHGLAVPFTLDGRSGRIGIYKYTEVPVGETDALDSLWLEVYLGEDDQPQAVTRFSPSTLSTESLELVRRELASAWNPKASSVNAGFEGSRD